MSMYDRIFSYCVFDACAPIMVVVSSGLPRRMRETRSSPSATKPS